MKNLISVFAIVLFFVNNTFGQDNLTPMIKEWISGKSPRKVSINNKKEGLKEFVISQKATVLSQSGDYQSDDLIFCTTEGNKYKIEGVTISKANEFWNYYTYYLEKSNIKGMEKTEVSGMYGININLNKPIKLLNVGSSYFAESSQEKIGIGKLNETQYSIVLQILGGKKIPLFVYNAPDGKKFEIYDNPYISDNGFNYYYNITEEELVFYTIKTDAPIVNGNNIVSFQYVSIPTKNIKAGEFTLRNVKWQLPVLQVPISKSTTHFLYKEGKTTKTELKDKIEMAFAGEPYSFVQKVWYEKFSDNQKKAFDNSKNVRQQQATELSAQIRKDALEKTQLTLEYQAEKDKEKRAKVEQEAKENPKPQNSFQDKVFKDGGVLYFKGNTCYKYNNKFYDKNFTEIGNVFGRTYRFGGVEMYKENNNVVSKGSKVIAYTDMSSSFFEASKKTPYLKKSVNENMIYKGNAKFIEYKHSSSVASNFYIADVIVLTDYLGL